VNTHAKDLARLSRALGVIVAGLLLTAGILAPGVARAATFDPLNVIPYETYRASASMSAADIQAFLNTLSGPLKSVNTTDYVNPGGSGNKGTPWTKGQPKKTAAVIIYEACRAWNINPKVMLSTLQKEQSLLTVSNSSNASRLIKAVGCGVYGTDPKTGKTINRFPGFGNQIWNGTRVLSTYEVTYNWVPGKVMTGIHDAPNGKIVPKNASTFALYTYTPYYPQKLVWDVYVRYFGDPQAAPRLRPVYRFRNKSNGHYFYTASEAKRYTLIKASSGTWSYEGSTFTVDTSATANSASFYQLYNTRTHVYSYTAYTGTRDKLLKTVPKQWRLDGAVCRVSLDSSGTAPVYRLQNRKTHAMLYTSSSATKKSLTAGGSHSAYSYMGVSFYLAALKTTPQAVGPTSAH
jgi:hypothetical protein